MEGGSYHGYATTDYYRVDPRFGTNEDYVRLIEKTHERGMRVVMDMIFNHCGSDHPWMKDIPSHDWFNNLDNYVQTNHDKEAYFDPYVSDYDKETMLNGWFVPSMPDLNQKNPTCSQIPYPELYLVDRVLRRGWYPSRYVSVCRRGHDAELVYGGHERVSGV